MDSKISEIDYEQNTDSPVYDTKISAFGGWIRDLREGMCLAPAWFRISIMDVNSHYRRFVLGPSWVTLGMSLFVFALGYVYSYLRGMDPNVFIPYLAAGMIGWTFISSSINQGMNVFVKSRKFIENVKLPFHYFVFKTMFDIFYTAILTFPVFAICVVVYDVPLYASNWMSLAAIPLYILSSYSVVVLIGILHLKVRDIQNPLSNFMRLMFLITPIIWMVEQRAGSKRAAFVDYNPFYHYLEIFRAPLLGGAAEPINWIVASSCTAGLFILACITFILYWRKIHYWV